VSNRRRNNKDKLPPFVPLLRETLTSAAWRAMSPYARILYIALKAQYSVKSRNNGRIYRSVRDAMEDTGLSINTVARGFHELVHYGFIVMTNPGCLGVDGKGKAPHWRLTELGYMTDPPTRDFMRWDGVLFPEHRASGGRAWRSKKQNPVSSDETGCIAGRDIQVYRGKRQSTEQVYRGKRHTGDSACLAGRDITSITTTTLESGAANARVKGTRARACSD
jgi:hypothetical protein